MALPRVGRFLVRVGSGIRLYFVKQLRYNCEANENRIAFADLFRPLNHNFDGDQIAAVSRHQCGGCPHRSNFNARRDQNEPFSIGWVTSSLVSPPPMSRLWAREPSSCR
jgi:hypothetical protein